MMLQNFIHSKNRIIIIVSFNVQYIGLCLELVQIILVNKEDHLDLSTFSGGCTKSITALTSAVSSMKDQRLRKP